MSEQIRGPRVHRPAASAVWELDHRWGRQFGDSTSLYVTRTAGGSLRISYGREEVEIRAELVDRAAEMIAAAAAWSDTAATQPTDTNQAAVSAADESEEQA